MNKCAQGNADLLTQLLGANISKEESNTPARPLSNEIYQLPIKGTPNLIGAFSPNAPTDARHTHHDGIDLAAPKGTNIYAPASGVVTETGVNDKGGNYLKTSHENGKVVFYYAHCDTVVASKGQQINQQSILATVGKTGNARFTSSHLHYSCKVNGALVSPLSIIGKPVGSLTKSANLIKDTLELSKIFYSLIK